ncbi:pilus assembly protein [Carnobacterium divergens]|uniref:Pilus assembly protein n=1 Tax=Carnobacterium divergens TaxID=2748 RepID=A0AAW8R9U7_CARDV|nr:pilus assembly protein [Carnobacterium divergens]MDT1957329.1 pilus assembly protein [Carnobacterium divergens]MDT1973299.1 pilus assembly protein [Carnobacterium divergens]
MNKFLKENSGSMILEAAMVLPIFLTFIFFLWTMIQVSVVQIALDKATSDSVQKITKNGYLIGVLLDGADKTQKKYVDKLNKKVDTLFDNATGGETKLSYDIANTFITDQIGKFDIVGVVDSAVYPMLYDTKAEGRMETMISERFSNSLAGNWADQIKIEEVHAENARGKNQKFKVKASFKIPLNIPFMKKFEFKVVSQSAGYFWTTEG